MADYFVTIKETNIYGTKVSADSPEEACDKAWDLFGEAGEDGTSVTIDTTFEVAGVVDLDSIRCHRCGGKVDVSDVDGYSYACPACNENLYSFEVRKVE